MASAAQLAAETGNPSHALSATPRTSEELSGIVEEFAARPWEWMDRVRLRTDRRWYERLYQGSNYEVWLITWLPGQSTGFHDHGSSSGAFAVASGELEEHRPGVQIDAVRAGSSRIFGPGYKHDVRNASPAPAISIHAYSPPLTDMNEYELDGVVLVPRETADRVDAVEQDWRTQAGTPADWPDAQRIDDRASATQPIEQVLAAARTRLRRLSPEDAYQAIRTARAVLVDIRPAAQRADEGSIPGALVVERNVLEWRFDPASDARLPVATSHDLQVIVVCSEGYTSSLAAAALQDLGLWRATDVVGGFHAWLARGLPTVPESQ